MPNPTCPKCGTITKDSKFNEKQVYCPTCRTKLWKDSGREIIPFNKPIANNEEKSTEGGASGQKIIVDILLDIQEKLKEIKDLLNK